MCVRPETRPTAEKVNKRLVGKGGRQMMFVSLMEKGVLFGRSNSRIDWPTLVQLEKGDRPVLSVNAVLKTCTQENGVHKKVLCTCCLGSRFNELVNTSTRTAGRGCLAIPGAQPSRVASDVSKGCEELWRRALEVHLLLRVVASPQEKKKVRQTAV